MVGIMTYVISLKVQEPTGSVICLKSIGFQTMSKNKLNQNRYFEIMLNVSNMK